MTKLSNSESEFLSTWCEAKTKLRRQDKAARETRSQIEGMEKQLRKLFPRAGVTISNGEWNAYYENKSRVGFVVKPKSFRLWHFMPV